MNAKIWNNLVFGHNLVWAIIGLFIFLGLYALPQSPDEEVSDTTSVQFKKYTITNDFISEGVAVGDINKDGHTDIITGAYWFEAPDWKAHEISTPQSFLTTEYGNSFLNFTMDVNQDGWLDVIRVDFPGEPGHWFENPGRFSQHWEAHLIDESVGNESPAFVNLDGKGASDLVFANEELGQMAWFKLPENPGQQKWVRYPISEKDAPGTDKFSHGLGVGKINDDNKPDVIIGQGWWEAPDDPQSSSWRFHEADFGEETAQIYSYDFDADGDNDVVASSPHNYGIWWFEQQNTQGEITWTRHTIFEEFSQTHSLAFSDVDADGDPDLVTGKRYYAHNGKDPGAHEPAAIYWFEFTRNQNNEPSWIPHQIDDDSGSGLDLVVQDITNDDRADIVTANKKGVFFFEQLSN